MPRMAHIGGNEEGAARAVLVVHAHPDDETIYMGGTLAKYAAAGVRIVCATGTRGELGDIVDPSLATSANVERLGTLRMDEMARALGRLGPIESRWLGYRDSGMDGGLQGDDPETFCRVPADEVAGRVARLIREIRPQVVITLDEAHAGDHPDHLHAAVAARLAFEGAADPNCWPDQLHGDQPVEAWKATKLYAANGHSRAPLGPWPKFKHLLREQGPINTLGMVVKAVTRRLPGRTTPPSEAPAEVSFERLPATTQIDVAAWVGARYAAIREYRTQIPPDDPMLALSARELATLSPTEDFRLLAGPTAHLPEDDLFAGID
jgi:N-acetyl-1-D-myo-inositol-2-amino-2-deoxy-alpha-D-glucopyranoside deacetylase